MYSKLTALSAHEAIEQEPLLAGADLGGVMQLPYWRVDPLAFHKGLELAWAAAGVQRCAPLPADELRQRLEQGEAVVLCSGAATLALLKAMGLQTPSALDFGWAGVGQCDGAQLAAERIVMPLLGQRSGRETAVSGAAVICDPGLAPAPGGGLLVGQTSWFDRSNQEVCPTKRPPPGAGAKPGSQITAAPETAVSRPLRCPNNGMTMRSAASWAPSHWPTPAQPKSKAEGVCKPMAFSKASVAAPLHNTTASPCSSRCRNSSAGSGAQRCTPAAAHASSSPL